MINSVDSSQNRVLFMQQLSRMKSHPSMRKNSGTDTSSGSAINWTVQDITDRFAQNGNNNLKATLALAALLEGQEKGNATIPAEINKSYWEAQVTETGGRWMRMAPIGIFTSNHAVWACVDDSSTPENPVIYVETVENSVRSAHKIDINKIDLSNMTRAEGFALCRYVGSSGSSSKDVSPYLNLIDLFRGFLGPGGIERAMRGEDPESFQEKVNLFNELAEKYLSCQGVSQSLIVQARSELHSILKDSSLSTVEQFVKIYGVMSHISSLTRGAPEFEINVNDLKSVQDMLLAQGVDLEQRYQSEMYQIASKQKQ